MATKVIPDNFIVLPNLDLTKTDVLDQDLESLMKVEQQYKRIAVQLNNRLSNVKQKLAQINERVVKSRQKVDSLGEARGALNIISPSKFVKNYIKRGDEPLQFHESVNPDFIFNEKAPYMDYLDNTNLNTKFRPEDLKRASSGTGRHDDDMSLLRLTKLNLQKPRQIFNGPAIQDKNGQGLGQVPRKIKYVDSLVVFNSNKNPYRTYAQFDNLAGHAQVQSQINKKKIIEDRDKINLAEAPRTLVEGEMIQKYNTQDYRFKPQMKELPQLKAPTQLSGLKGVVDIDLGFGDETNFVPSKGGTVNKPTAPEPMFNTTQNQPSGTGFDETPPNYNYTTHMLKRGSTMLGQPQQTQQSNAPTLTTSQSNYTPSLSSGPTISSITPLQTSQSMNAPQTNSGGGLPPPTQNSGGGLPPPGAGQTGPGANKLGPPPKLTPPPTNLLPPPGSNTSVGEGANKLGPPPGGVNLPKPGDPGAGDQIKELPPITDNRSRLLDEIRNPNPMARLKKAQPKEKRPPLQRKTKGKAEPAMSHMDHLKQQIQLRFQALNKKNKKAESESESESD